MQIPSENSQQFTGRFRLPAWNLARRKPLIPPLRALLCLVMGSSLALCPAAVRCQEQPPVPPAGFPASDPPNPSTDPALRRMTEHMALERNTQRQQTIVADTARLLDLAKELNAAVAHSTKDTLSIGVVKKADEIEKLAKTIKQKMRDGE